MLWGLALVLGRGVVGVSVSVAVVVVGHGVFEFVHEVGHCMILVFCRGKMG